LLLHAFLFLTGSPKRLEVIGLFGFDLFAAISATAKKIQDYVDAARAEGIVEKNDFVQRVKAAQANRVDPLFEYLYAVYYSIILSIMFILCFFLLLLFFFP
jgi:hypothetical protein